MLPGNVDPRRPDKVQRYKPPAANANGQGEDLTPDYMNILGMFYILQAQIFRCFCCLIIQLSQTFASNC